MESRVIVEPFVYRPILGTLHQDVDLRDIGLSRSHGDMGNRSLPSALV